LSRSLKFPVAVHVLVALAVWRDKYVSSEVLAKTVATNAVVVRRTLQALKRAGLVKSQGGAQGGSMLAVEPEDVTLLDVFDSVEELKPAEVHDGCPGCTIAKAVIRVVPEMLDQAEAARRAQLDKFTLAEILEDVYKLAKAAG